MLKFREFMMSEAGAGSQLGQGMTPRRHRVAKDFSPTPPLGSTLDQAIQHRMDNIATVLRYLYDHYQSGIMVIVNQRHCIAATEVENWHEEMVNDLIDKGVLVEMPIKQVYGRWVSPDLSGSIPTFSYYSPSAETKFYTTEETLQQYDQHEIQEWIVNERLGKQPEQIHMTFYAIDPKQIFMTMQRQKMYHGVKDFAARAWGQASQDGFDKGIAGLRR